MRYHPRMLPRPFASASLRAVRAARIALVWLVLAMALGQLAAVRHAYSHAPGEASTQSGSKHPGGLAHCDACIAVAALGAGGPPPANLVVAALGQRLPLPDAQSTPSIAPQQRPYAIRAPPSVAS